MPSLNAVFSSDVILLPTFSKVSSILLRLFPKKQEIIAGGASLAPSLLLLVAVIIDARIRS